MIEKAEEPFILTGVILDEEEKIPIEGFFSYIKRKYGIDTTFPFHSYDIFESLKTRKLSDADAASLLEALADFISLIPIKIHIMAINKKQFKAVLGATSDDDFKGSSDKKEMKEFPYKIASCMLFKWFAPYLKKNHSIGEIIVDARRGGDYQLIKSLYGSKQPDGFLDNVSANLIAERCTAICFAEKKFLSGGLELTDLISYTAFFHARRKISTMSKIKLDVVWAEIRKKLYRKDLDRISEEKIRNFFKIKKGEAYKYLKKT
ncbi:hypothetical protein KJ980_05520 [Patescibacteria group bacterium]|nr:hypothetical protein [Patescibacteria group bacterium]MBU4016843.1 hypothetical protein [Patescibacteria group bacterium]MBU4099080.1 hypothetical protein [Patescibacteria group bacterium]